MMNSVFIISLSYVKPLDQVSAHLDEHIAFLKKYYESGVFMMSGRKVPRTGGVIIASAGNREEVETIIREDPFHRERIAEFEITEIVPTMTNAALEGYRVDI